MEQRPISYFVHASSALLCTKRSRWCQCAGVCLLFWIVHLTSIICVMIHQALDELCLALHLAPCASYVECSLCTVTPIYTMHLHLSLLLALLGCFHVGNPESFVQLSVFCWFCSVETIYHQSVSSFEWGLIAMVRQCSQSWVAWTAAAESNPVHSNL